ncbi:MAG TPA: hypothetical protein PK745_09495, partial [bacterium]|nr:hypothetical protein [bacterium]
YVKEAIRLLKEEEKVFTVLSYLPIEEPVISYQWLELCYSISQRYPKNYAFAAFILQANSFKPFSYHIYDHKNIHMGLRAYSPHQDVPRISSSITLNNKMLAEKFYYEFIENFKSIGKMNEAIHAKLVLDLGVDSKIKSDTLNAIDKLLR